MTEIAVAVSLGIAFALAALIWVRLGALERKLGPGQPDTLPALGMLQEALHAQLAGMQQAVSLQAGQTAAAVADVRERLGALHEQSREIADLARNVGSLQDLLRPPKVRGGMGELLLERLLEDILPGRYERQYEFPTTRTRVDAVVRIGDKLVPIDAKFPLDMYAELTKASTEEERRSRRRAFLQALKRHIDQVAERYIVPRDRTVDYAFLYVPSEAVYYEIIVREDADTTDLRQYFQDRRVLPVSPNTLQAFLAAVHLGLRGMAIQERAKEIQAYLAQLGQELARLDAEHQKLGRHLDNARQVHELSTRYLARIGERLRQASATAVPETAEQPPLPLDGDDR